MAEKRKYADRREELIKAVAKRRRKIKTLAIEYMGGQCQICGYHKCQNALDLHHIKIGIILYFVTYFKKHHKHYHDEHFIYKIGTVGEEFYENFIGFFKHKNRRR